MYVPKHFAVDDLPRLHDFMEQQTFATLVSGATDGLTGSHVPLLLSRGEGRFGTLWGHFARANEHWRLASGKAALAIFHGPHAYISPSWYESANVVPTWNYVAVHATGSLEIVEDAERVIDILARTVEFYERSHPQPWSFAEGDEFIKRLVGGIVAFRIEIARIEGKWKLSQNHSVERRERVVAALRRRSAEGDREIAELMATGLGGNERPAT